MKNIISLLLIISLAVIGALLIIPTAQANDEVPLSDSHKSRIVANCTPAKSSLQQLHRSDASLRVNRGQLYEYISTKLMARLNSRLALNHLDASELVAATARYGRSLNQFREVYQTYEEQLTVLLRVNCQNQPEEFYYRVLDVRQKRLVVAESVRELGQQIADYYQIFERFSDDFRLNKEVEQ